LGRIIVDFDQERKLRRQSAVGELTFDSEKTKVGCWVRWLYQKSTLIAVIGHERRHLYNQDRCGVVFQINDRWQCEIELLAKLHNLHCRYFRLKLWSTIRHRQLELM
jgi:hypothetical protein